jgi:hypothetical protein
MKVLHFSHGAAFRDISKKAPHGRLPQHGVEESFKLKRTFLFSILAMSSGRASAPGSHLPVSSPPYNHATDEADKTYKYEVYAGYAYTSLNQVNSRAMGLQGVNVSVTRDFGKYFGVTAEGDYFKYPSPLRKHGQAVLPSGQQDSWALAPEGFAVNDL